MAYSMNNPSDRLTRWAVKLSKFDFTIKYRTGVTKVITEFLSRSTGETSVLDVSTFKPYRWYRKMIEEVKRNPESCITFRVENGIL